MGGRSGRRGLPVVYNVRLYVPRLERVGLVSRELANERGMPDAFFGTVPV